MLYKSTRSEKNAKFSAAYVIKNGLAADGGLYVPETIPTISSNDIEMLCGMDYPHRAANILSRFLTDYTYEELLEDRVHLFLFVKVRENWQEDAGRYSVWGLDFKA